VDGVRHGGWVVAMLAAALLAAAPAAIAAGPSPAASVLVPGFGLEPAGQVVAALAQPVRARGPGFTVTVTGVWAWQRDTYVDITVAGGSGDAAAYPDTANLVGADGRAYAHRGDAFGAGVKGATAQLWFAPLRRGASLHLTLVIPVDPAVRIPLRLVPVADLRSPASSGPWITVNGVTLAAIPYRVGTGRIVEVVVAGTPPGDPSGQVGLDGFRRPDLVERNGRVWALSLVTPFAGGVAQYAVPGGARLAGATVVVQGVAAQVVGPTRQVTLRLPASGAIAVDIPVVFGSAKATLTRVDRLDPTTVRVDTTGSGPVRLGGVTVSDGFAQRLAPDGALQWIELHVPRRATRVTLFLSLPDVAVTGPWRLPVGR